MVIYTFRSKLFQGMDQKRIVILSSYFADAKLVETLVNADNNYSEENRWKLEERKEA
jgi:hypothetical protein